MDDCVTRRIIKPEQCVVGFGIPTSREGFLRAQASPANRDFVVNNCSDLRDYEREVLNYTDEMIPVLKGLGATVLPDLTLPGFGQLLKKNPPVVILFAHWRTDSVEFNDGLARIEDVIKAVPPDYDGIIDLCVCHPKELALGLRRVRRECVVKFPEDAATPALWLFFYEVLLTKLRDAEMTYLAAVESTISNFQRELVKKSWRDYIKFLRNFLSKPGL